MDYIGYDEYLAKFESDPEDDDDLDIKQLKYNALFDEEEEEGWVIVLPDFKPYRYNIQPLPNKPIKWHDDDNVYDSGLEQHDQIVSSLKEMTLTMSGKDYYSSERMRTAAPTNRQIYNPLEQRSRRSSNNSEYKERQIYEGRSIIDEGTLRYNDYNEKIYGNGNNNTMNATCNRNKSRVMLHRTG